MGHKCMPNTSQLSVTNLSKAATGGRPHLHREEAQRQEQGMTTHHCAGRREWVPVQAGLLTREPRSCEVLPSLWHLARGQGRKREGKAERPKLRGNSTQRLRLQPFDLHPIAFPSEISWELPPFLVLGFHTRKKKYMGSRVVSLSRCL